MNRRENPRMDVKLKCHVAPMKTWPQGLSGVTENISRNGVLMLCAEGCAGEQPRVGEVVTVEIELPENPVFGRKCIHCQATVVRVSGETGQPLRVAFSVNQMKFTEYGNPAAQLCEMEANAGTVPA
ncbi:MAG TPA: PilZ domain-containing protein [Bryobacteraceae bacterium]|nr:PilZ domain-containing protein [Bryobacteraceae bacterium]